MGGARTRPPAAAAGSPQSAGGRGPRPPLSACPYFEHLSSSTSIPSGVGFEAGGPDEAEGSEGDVEAPGAEEAANPRDQHHHPSLILPNHHHPQSSRKVRRLGARLGYGVAGVFDAAEEGEEAVDEGAHHEGEEDELEEEEGEEEGARLRLEPHDQHGT